MSSPSRQKPNKVLAFRATNKTDLDAWPYEDFPGDPYWQGGPTPKPYRWLVEMSVSSQAHGDPSTRQAFLYNGSDIYVGDWVADVNNGKTLKVVKITEKSDTSVTVVLEDVDRYNTFLDENGSGMFTLPSDGIVFSISDAKAPILNPLPSSISNAVFTQEVVGRFNNNNPLFRTRVMQKSHSLKDNDTIWVDPADGLFKTVSTDDELKRAVGTVDIGGPGGDVFYFIPTTKVVESINPPLPGNAGDIIYADPFTGEMTLEESERAKAIYIQLTNAMPDTTTSVGSTVDLGAVLGINNVENTFTGSTLLSAVNDINTRTDQHNVVAELQAGENEASTIQDILAYGICACIGTSAIAEINNVAVAFDDDTNGQAEFGFSAVNAVDMANAINAADIDNISAVGVGSIQLTIKHATGGEIVMSNIANDDSGTPFAGSGSCTGLPQFTEAGGSETILFTNSLGSGIIFADIVGSPVGDLGLTSVRNGELPSGLVVEQMMSGAGTTNVYATLSDLPATSVVGRQAFVIDSEDENGNKANEWTMFLWDGFNWIKTSDEDSARVDARSIETTVTFDSETQIEVGTLSDGKSVTQVIVEVSTEFDGIPVLNIGDTNDPLRLMQDDFLDLSTFGSYSTTSNFIYNTGNDVTILASFNPGGATVGKAKIIVSYI